MKKENEGKGKGKKNDYDVDSTNVASDDIIKEHDIISIIDNASKCVTIVIL